MALTAMTVPYRYSILVATGFVASAVAYPKPAGTLSLVDCPDSADDRGADLRAAASRVGADPNRDGDDRFEPTYDAILFAVGVFVIAIHLMVVAALTGARPAQKACILPGALVLLGVVVVRIGNLLPRTRPNLAFGIRTPRTLANRGLWMQTHRMAGYVAVGLGAVLVVSAAFLSQPRLGNVWGSPLSWP